MIGGLYAITDPDLCGGEYLLPSVKAALIGGARVVQYRNKRASQQQKRTEAKALNDLVRGFGACFLVNDDVQLARDVGAHGVHLGQSDQCLREARRALGENAVIGISCHGGVGLGLQAAKDGASYIALGRFFPSQTKPLALPASVDILPELKRQLSIPLVAIGGILPQNGLLLIEAGADALAVIHGLFSSVDIAEQARAYTNLF